MTVEEKLYLDNALWLIENAQKKLLEAKGLGKKKRLVIDEYIAYSIKGAIANIKKSQEA